LARHLCRLGLTSKPLNKGGEAMMDTIPRSWKAKRWLWTRWHTLRFSLAKPQNIGPP
jgi:hypothetical protein